MGNRKVNKWFMAIKNRSADIFDLSGASPIEPDPETYHADPFLFSHNGREFLFFEDYDYDKGVISYKEIKPAENEYSVCQLGPTTKCLIRPYHLSFPFLIEDEGEVYMIPETGRAAQIEIYRAEVFPSVWKFAGVLVPGVCASDVVVHKQDGYYWMFTTIGGDDRWHVYRSKHLLDHWQLVKSVDLRHSRPAGNIFTMNGKLYMPTQDSVEVYGRAMVINEITLPDLSRKEVRRIEHDWYPGLIGTHTFNFNDKYVVTDGKIKL